MWTPKKATEEEGTGGEGGGAPGGMAVALYRRGPVVVSTSGRSGGRSATVGQPPVQTAVGRLPPLAVAIGACRAGHVVGHCTAVGRGGWWALTAV
jgi:hypothetical protein